MSRRDGAVDQVSVTKPLVRGVITMLPFLSLFVAVRVIVVQPIPLPRASDQWLCLDRPASRHRFGKVVG